MFDSFFRANTFYFASMLDPGGKNLLRLLAAVPPRKYISNFEGPYLHSPMRLAKNSVVKKYKGMG
jgi:hypothetical protein